MKNCKLWRAFWATLVCAALMCGMFSALAEGEFALEDGNSVPSDADAGDSALELSDDFACVEDLPEPVLNNALALDGDTIVAEPEGILLPEGDGANEAAASEAASSDAVPLVASYSGEALTKVYDCNSYGAYTRTKDDGSKETVYVIEALKTIKGKFSLAPAEGYDWVEGHEGVTFSLSLSKQFESADAGEYNFTFTLALTGDNAAWYTLPTATVQVPATITPRPVTITPRADLSKYYGDQDPVYASGTSFTLKTTDGTEVVKQSVAGVATYGVPKFTSDDLDVLKYLIKDAQLKQRDFFPGFLGRKSGEKAGRYRITIGDLDFGGNFTITLAEEYFTIKPRALTDSAVTVTDISDKTYTGKTLKPAPVVRFNGKKLKAGTHYTLKYTNNKNPGSGAVTVTGKGNFTGARKLTFKIVLKPTAISKLTPGSGQITVTWKKGSLNSGYEVSYSLDSDFSAATTRTVKGAGKTSLVLKGLDSRQTYYVRVRTYKTVKGTTYYSAWSKAKKARTK